METLTHGSRQWPTASQRLLLQATVFDGDSALRAWREWRASNDLDAASPFVLPALYLNLNRLAPKAPEIARLREAYQFAWTRTQKVVRTASVVLRLLQRAGITPTILKGVPLVLFHYRDGGARRMQDVDMLIQPSEVAAATAALAAGGWAPRFHLPPEHLRPFSPACAYTHPNWMELDLHWRPFTIDCPAAVEERFHQRTQPRVVLGVPVRVPDTTDLLFFTCFHSRKRDAQASCRWVVDALTLIQRVDPPIDWDALLDRAGDAGLLLPIRDTLSYLQREFDAAIPADVLWRAAQTPATTLDLTRYERLSKPRNLPELVQLHWWLYSGGCRAGPAGPSRAVHPLLPGVSAVVMAPASPVACFPEIRPGDGEGPAGPHAAVTEQAAGPPRRVLAACPGTSCLKAFLGKLRGKLATPPPSQHRWIREDNCCPRPESGAELSALDRNS